MKQSFWWKSLLSSVALAVVLSAPVIPSAWAKPPAVKILHEEIHHKAKSDFAGKGNDQLVLAEEGGKVGLTVKEEGKTAIYTSPVIRAKQRFTDVGAHWMSGPATDKHAHEHIRVEVRSSEDGTAWTDWREAHVDDAHGRDDMKTTETFAELLGGQRGRFLQYRITLTAEHRVKPWIRDFKLTLINSEDGERVTAKSDERVSLASLLEDKVEAAIGKPPIVSRAEWGADESLRYNPDGTEKWPRVYSTPVTHMMVHHTDTPNDDPDPAARVRSIYYYHTVTRGWGDIGYNAIIGSDGRIYEGRKGQDGDVLTNGVVAAHAYSFNYHSFGVSMMGNYSLKNLPDPMRNSLIDLLSYVADLNGIDPNTVKDYVRDYQYSDPNVPQTDPNVPTLTGHGLLPRQTTDCPGEFNRDDLVNLRNRVSERLNQSPVIVDNDAPGNIMTGSWAVSTYSSQRYGADYVYSSAGTGADTFTWNFNLPATGTYRVSVWYSAGSNRASNAPFTVYAKTGPATVTVNQQVNGGMWVDLGTYEFASGPNKVVLSDNADNLVVADAIKVEYVPVPDSRVIGALVDDSSPSGYIAATPSLTDWPTSSNVAGGYAGKYRPHAPNKGATFTFKPDVPQTGNYKVYVWYTAASDRATNAPYTIHYSGGSVTHYVNQRTSGGQWVYLGTYPFDQGMSGSIVLSDNANGYVIADAVKLVKE
jgi:hypothetical protein